jgi:cyclase
MKNPLAFSCLSICVIYLRGLLQYAQLADGIIQGGAEAVLAASIFHFGEYTLEQAKLHL